MLDLSPQHLHLIRQAIENKIANNDYQIRHLDQHIDLSGAPNVPDSVRYVKSLMEQNLALREIMGRLGEALDDP